MKEYFKKVDNIIVDDLIMALDNGINEIHNIGTPKQTLMNLWQTTNVKHFANTHYYIFRTNFKNYDRKERDAAY